MAGILLGVAFAVAFAALLLNRRIREMMAARKKPLRRIARPTGASARRPPIQGTDR